MTNFKEASYYKKLDNKKVRCILCPHDCIIGNGEVGICKVRMNIHGKLKAMNYAKPHTVMLEKIKDFPLYHFLPKSRVLALGTLGDNLEKQWDRGSYYGKGFDEVKTINQDSMQIIKQAESAGVKVIGYKYGEPGLFFEFVRDISNNSRRLKHIMVTNGYIQREPARKISRNVDGVLFDIPSMNEEFFNNFLNGKLEHVLNTMKIFHDAGVWTEIKMTLLPSVHKNFYDVRKLISWILNNLDQNVPVHFVTYDNGEYKTPSEFLERARKMSRNAGMNYVYTHGSNLKEGEITFCPNCKKPLVYRNTEKGFNFINEGKCSCGKEIAGVWQ